MSRFARITLSLAALTAFAFAQVPVGTIQGTVLDPAGALIPNAKVTLSNQDNGVEFKLTGSGEGRFVQPALLPGNYQIVTEATGFSRSVIRDIRLNAGQTVQMDVNLKLGDVASSIEVTADAAQLQTETSTVISTINRKSIVDLPLAPGNRSPLALVTTVAGVMGGGGSTPWIGGGRNATSEILIDGNTAVLPENNVSINDGGYTPIIDSVEEVAVIKNSLAAEYGRTGGGAITMTTRSGNNALHFSLYEFHQNHLMNANSWTNNRNNVGRGVDRRNQFGFTFGAPIVIPKIYDGHNKTFIFWSQQFTPRRQQATSTQTVPIQAWRDGDFSDLRTGTGLPITLYDPLTQVAGSNNRQPFVGNRIPVARQDRLSMNLLKFFPNPNTLPLNQYTNQSNFVMQGPATSNDNRFDSRIDHYFKESFRMFMRGSYDTARNTPVNAFGNVLTPGSGPQYQAFPNVTANFIYTANPTTIVNMSVGYGRKDDVRQAFSTGTRISEFGFSRELEAIASRDNLEFPQVNTGSGTLGQGGFTTYDIKSSAFTVHGDVTKIKGSHNIKMGGEFRKLLMNFAQYGSPAGTFGFGAGFTQQVIGGAANVQQGFAFASYLLGLPNSNGAALTHTMASAQASEYFGVFLSDDWKVTKKLSLNIGLRWDLDTPRTERFNRLSYFDLYAPSPLRGRVAAYPNLQGAYKFVDADNRRQTNSDTNNWGPRFGFAYQIDSKTVFRGAYGITYSANPYMAAGTTGTAGTQGYTSNTPFNISNDNGRTFIASFSNPFPLGYNLPLGAAGGAGTQLGFDIGGGNGGLFINNQNPMIQQWNGTLERELGGGWLVEIGYLANKGNQLVDGEGNLPFNQLRGDEVFKLGETLRQQVPNPFFGILPANANNGLGAATIQLNRLLSAYPQYSSVSAFRVPQANSNYHAFTIEATKRFSRGFQMTAAFTGGKLIDDASSTVNFLGAVGAKQDFYNRQAEKSVSAQDVSKRFVVTYNYELPFGKNHAFFSTMPAVLEYALGGWQINGIWTMQKGLPIQINNGGNNSNVFNPGQRPNNNGTNPLKTGEIDQRLGNTIVNGVVQNPYFDISSFSQAGLFTFGNVGRTLPNLRNPSVFNMDFSLFKTFTFMDKLTAQLRGESFNTFNHPTWAGPGTNVTAPATFGVIQTANGNRTMQVALKLNY
jgi:hypothetical protein